MPQPSSSDARRGVLAMLGACVIWGLAPIFYDLLRHVPASDILAHRVLWSFVFFAVVLAFQGRLGILRQALTDRGQVWWIVLSASIISINWFFFIYAIQIGKLSESSLGYYMFPLVSVTVGYLFFQETLARLQWVSVGLAALAVAILTVGLGAAPWISGLLAVSFTAYGVVKKRVRTGSVVSVTAEVFVTLPLVAAWFLYQGGSAWPSAGTIVLLVLSGPLTATPMILFSYAAQRIRLSTLGLLQYINPTLQFLVAALIFGESMTLWHGIAFPLIWIALAIYSGVAIAQDRAARKSRTNAATLGTV